MAQHPRSPSATTTNPATTDQFDRGDVVIYVGDATARSVQPGGIGSFLMVDSHQDAYVSWEDHGVAIVPISSIRKADVSE